MARQITLSTELSLQPKLACYFKTEPTVIVQFSFGISENTMFSNVINSYHLVDERYISSQAIFIKAKKKLFEKIFCYFYPIIEILDLFNILGKNR
jgi:hypothetical protein